MGLIIVYIEIDSNLSRFIKEVSHTEMMLKLKRVEKRIKQKNLAKMVGVSQQYLCSIENCRSKNPSRDIMIKLASALDCSVQELFFSEEQTNQTH